MLELVTTKSIFDIVKNEQTQCGCCITTNGCCRKNGNGIMKAGIAKQFLEIYPNAEKVLGRHLRENGNIVGELGKIGNVTFLSFPTKDNWRDNSSIKLICNSCISLMNWKYSHPEIDKIYMVPPGCGLGGLNYSEVINYILPLLDNSIIMVVTS